MPKRVSATGVDSDTLRALRARGVSSGLLDARLQFMESAQILRQHIGPLMTVDRVYPGMLPTQASHRWSTSKPPLVNFPPDCLSPDCAKAGTEHMPKGCGGYSARDVVVPDEGWCWLRWDWDAIEARIAAAYAGDTDDLDAFNRGWDVHTLTACRMFGLPLPPDLVNPHDSLEGAGWRSQVGWQGKDDRRRHLAKTFRYATQYGSDEFAVLESRDVEKLGLARDDVLQIARQYLAAKPRLVAAKRATWEQVAKTGEARTFLGARRKLFMSREDHERWLGRRKPCEAQRAGWSHRVSGAVAGIMDRTLIAIDAQWPESVLVLNKHDGADVAFPTPEPAPSLRTEFKALVAREWSIGGRTIMLSAEFGMVHADGTKGAL